MTDEQHESPWTPPAPDNQLTEAQKLIAKYDATDPDLRDMYGSAMIEEVQARATLAIAQILDAILNEMQVDANRRANR